MAVALALSAAFLIYLRGDSSGRRPSGKSPDARPDARSDATAKDGSNAPGSGLQKLPPDEHAKTLSEFHAQYDKLKALIAARQEREAAIHKAHPEILEFQKYQNKVAAYATEHFPAERAALQKFEQENPDKALKYSELLRVAKPVEFLKLLNAEDDVGGVRLGTIVENVLTQTNYFESLRKELARVQREVFHDGKAETEAASIKSPNELMDALRAIAPRCGEESSKLVTATFPEALRGYVEFSMRKEMIENFSSMYKRSWEEDLSAGNKQIKQTQTALYELRNRAPRLSEARVEMDKLILQLSPRVTNNK